MSDTDDLLAVAESIADCSLPAEQFNAASERIYDAQVERHLIGRPLSELIAQLRHEPANRRLTTAAPTKSHRFTAHGHIGWCWRPYAATRRPNRSSKKEINGCAHCWEDVASMLAGAAADGWVYLVGEDAAINKVSTAIANALDDLEHDRRLP